MTDRQQQLDSQMRADFQRRLQENLAKAQMIKGKVLTNDKTPESKEKDC